MNWIRRSLKQAGIRQRALLDEMQDHFLTVYEELQLDGFSTKASKAEVLKQVQALNAKQLNKDIFFIHHSSKIVLSMITLLIVSIFISLNLSQDPPTSWPVDSKHVTSDFGMRMHPIKKELKLHKGIDIKAAIGDNIYAPSKGEVIASDYSEGYGHYIVIKHDDAFTTRYHHLHTRIVNKGDVIEKSQIIGTVGNSGLSVRPHLHYEVIKNGEHVDPREFLKV